MNDLNTRSLVREFAAAERRLGLRPPKARQKPAEPVVQRYVSKRSDGKWLVKVPVRHDSKNRRNLGAYASREEAVARAAQWEAVNPVPEKKPQRLRPSRSSTGRRGVSVTPAGRFTAKVVCGGESNYLGTFATVEEAAMAVVTFMERKGVQSDG